MAVSWLQQGPRARRLIEELANSPSIAGIWPCNEASGTIHDRTPNASDSTTQSLVSYGTAIKDFMACRYVGSESITIPDITALNLEYNQAFGILAVVTTPNLVLAEASIFGRYNGATPRGYKFGINASSQLLMTLRSDGTHSLRVRGGTTLAANTSYMVGMSCDGSAVPGALIAYVNGVAEAPTTVDNTLSGTIKASTSNPKIGLADGVAGDFWFGYIGLVAVLSRAPSANDFRRWANVGAFL